MSDKHFDYFVIGAGSGGVRSARIAAQHGAKVGVAEVSDLGGTCVNLGCIPKKILAYASDYGFHFDDARGFGWLSSKPEFEWETLIANKNKEISRLNGIYQKLLDNAGVEILNGLASFVDEKTLSVNGETITADNILIATGGKPRIPDIPGGELLATSDDAFFWPKMPNEVVIIGGGYIAVEFAHIFHGLGAHVTLCYRGNLFLRGFDESIRLALAEEMRKQGIDLHFDCDIEKAEQDGDRYILDTTQGHRLECDLPLSAIGRVPNIEALNLESAGVEVSKTGQIIVDDNYQTSRPNIYALGDVTDTPALTPVAIKEGHVLADRLFGEHIERSVNYNNIATAVFSYPPMAVVGLTEETALEMGYEIIVYTSDFKPMKHTMSGRDERSYMKLVVDCATDKVLGLHVMGMDAPEMVQGFAVAMNCGATKADFDDTMAMHPTSAEEFVLMRTGEKKAAA